MYHIICEQCGLRYHRSDQTVNNGLRGKLISLSGDLIVGQYM
jgi:hypothetical protein